MSPRVPNPVRLVVLAVGLLLARLGVVDERRARRTTDLAWPRVVTGIARMSKNAVDVAMVGIALGSAGIAGVGYAGPYWGLAFALGGGLAAGTIALVSQHYGGEDDATEGIGRAVRSSVLVVLAVTLPLVAALAVFAEPLIDLVSGNPEAVAVGGDYLRVVAFGVPFAALNLVGSRVFIGADDAWTPMAVRGGGAVLNIALNAFFIFALDMGAVGAATGTVLSNVAGTAAFAVGLSRGRLPGIGALPVQVDPLGPYVDLDTARDIVDIGAPVVGRSMVWTVAEFPMLAIADSFGVAVAAAYVIARRIWGIMNTPGWGFGLASSSLVGQSLGANDEAEAEAFGEDVIRHAVGVYLVSAFVVALFARPIVGAFDPTPDAIPVAVALVYAACVAVVMQGVSGGAAGPLDASGDTRWPFAAQAVGMFGCSIPLAYIGATTPLGLWGLYLAFAAETGVPAALNYYRFRAGTWKEVSRGFGPGRPADD
ncbi:MATE family efflux transporter [Halosegnis marinus]|uniref:Multidrug-efflux transporter n=2 Tax=Halosegnis marinus TaxID=3034023 RepID=A0ABD5ZN32_9EURY